MVDQLAIYAIIYSCRSVDTVGQLGVDQLTHHSPVGQLTQSVSLAVDQSVIGQSPLHRKVP
jgi:hypothetical protein